MKMKILTKLTLLTILGAVSFLPITSASAKTLTSAEKQAKIRKSIAAYSGSCPCPYNTMKNGRNCGKNSAWSKPGGKKPLCYEWEIK